MAVDVEFSTVPEMFDRITELFANESRPMLLRKAEKEYQGISFLQYRRNVERFALGLASLGVKSGDKVAIISENRPEWIVADMGTVALGAVDVPIYPILTAPQISYILNDSGSKVVVVSNALQLAKVLKILQEVKSLERTGLMNEKLEQRNNITMTFPEVFKIGGQFEKSHPTFFAGCSRG